MIFSNPRINMTAVRMILASIMLTLAFLCAAQMEAPDVNLEIVSIDDSDYIRLSWERIAEAEQYRIYSSTDPYIYDWGEPTAVVGDSIFVYKEPADENQKQFYRVTAYAEPDPPELVFVAGGEFTMGDTRGEGMHWELPTHQVTLSSFYIGKYPVTQAEWSAVMGYWEFAVPLASDHPAELLSWYAVLVYCNRRSVMDDLTPVYSINGSTDPDDWGAIPNHPFAVNWNSVECNWEADGYRLPTEAEWEFAARGGTDDPDFLYSGSDNINEVAWYRDNSNIGYGRQSHPVGSKEPNGLGIYDMSGNVWEWCWDPYYSYTEEPEQDPRREQEEFIITLRGGSWSARAEFCRVSRRSRHYRHAEFIDTGFRVARTP